MIQHLVPAKSCSFKKLSISVFFVSGERDINIFMLSGNPPQPRINRPAAFKPQENTTPFGFIEDGSHGNQLL